MALTDNLVEFWTLNGTLVGAIGGNTLVSADGLTHYVPGKIGAGWLATGSKRLIQSELFPFAGPWSYSGWINPTAANGYPFRWRNGGTAVARVEIQFTRRLLFYLGVQLVSSPGTLALNEWSHFVVSFQPLSESPLSIWLNGVGASGGAGATAPLAVSECHYGTGSLGSFSGALDAIGFWNRALTQTDVDDLYAAGAGWEPTVTDNTPDAFSFAPVTDAEPSTVYATDAAEISGMDAGTAVSITGGEYRVNGGDWTAAAGTIDPGDTLELRGTSSAESEGVVTVTVTVGTVSVNWTITTELIASVVTTILWGSTPDTSRILNSRIVRGML